MTLNFYPNIKKKTLISTGEVSTTPKSYYSSIFLGLKEIIILQRL